VKKREKANKKPEKLGENKKYKEKKKSGPFL